MVWERAKRQALLVLTVILGVVDGVLMGVAGVLLVGDGERANGERADWESGETIKYLRMFIQFGTLNGLQYSGPRQTLTVHTERPWCSVGYKSASQYDQTLERPRM
jgi:hypothetical protein